MSLPTDSYPIMTWLELGCDDENFLKVVDYAISRKLYELEKLYWSPSEYFFLNRRLIIPYYYQSKVVGFTARLFEDLESKEIPKYYQQCPVDFVYNLDAQNNFNRKYVIVNEGVLDAFNTDGVAILGEMNQRQGRYYKPTPETGDSMSR